jgi:hypothetical protein
LVDDRHVKLILQEINKQNRSSQRVDEEMAAAMRPEERPG